MTYDPKPITNEQLDDYLDGLMNAEQREVFEARLRAHPELNREIQLDAQIDASLDRLFPLEQASEEYIEDVITQASTSSEPSTSRLLPYRSLSRTMRVAILGLAAAVAWIIVGFQLEDSAPETPFFQAKPVAVVYQEVVENGFDPYYECREEDRFAAVFLQRQRQALRLATLPPGSRMLGLSYPGGLSRDTTAMLCRVDGQPVMVFIDRLENDLPIAARNDVSEIKVHRVARDGLVFYEVTPLDACRVIEYLVPRNADASSG